MVPCVSQQLGDTSSRYCSTSGCPSLLAMWKQFQPSLFLSSGFAPCSTRVLITAKLFLVQAIIRGVLQEDPGKSNNLGQQMPCSIPSSGMLPLDLGQFSSKGPSQAFIWGRGESLFSSSRNPHPKRKSGTVIHNF